MVASPISNPEPISYIETITPDMAEAIMASQNIDNRKLRRGRVAQYAQDMRRDMWLLTGQGLTFDTTGRLIDGQHRLAAIIEAGVPVRLTVMRNAVPEAYTVIDSGLARTAGDALAKEGFPAATHIAAIARLSIGWDAGIAHEHGSGAMGLITRQDITEFALDNRESIITARNLGERLYGGVGGNRTAWGALIFEVLPHRPDAHWDYFDRIISGVNLASGDPRLALRNWAATRRNVRGNGRRAVTAEMSHVHLFTYTKAWNYWVKGKQVGTIHTWKPESGPLRPLYA